MTDGVLYLLNNQYALHRAKPEDLSEVIALRIKAFGKKEGLENLVDSIKAPDAFDVPERLLLVRNTESGELIGAVRYHLPTKEGSVPDVLKELMVAKNHLYVDRLTVDPDARSEAVSALLFKGLVMIAEKEGIFGTVIICVRSLLRYYLSKGFEKINGFEEGITLGHLRPEPYYPLAVLADDWKGFLQRHKPELYSLLFQESLSSA